MVVAYRSVVVANDSAKTGRVSVAGRSRARAGFCKICFSMPPSTSGSLCLTCPSLSVSSLIVFGSTNYAFSSIILAQCS